MSARGARQGRSEDRARASSPVRYSFIKILTGSDLSRRRLPCMVARGGERPVAWLTACAHGDEVGGIVVIQEIFRRIRRLKSVRGSLHAFPLMNPLGFDTSSRDVTLSEEDLNRSFPGDTAGSLAERIAATIFGSIAETRPDLVIDVHNDWIHSVPYMLLDALPSARCREAHKRAIALGRDGGLPLVREPDAVPGSLTFNLIARDIPALTLELGESNVVNEANVQLGVRLIWHLLARVGVVEPWEEPFRYELPREVVGRVLEYSQRPMSSTSGVIRFGVPAGEMVQAGQPIAKVYNAFGKLQETLRAEAAGLVLGRADSSVAFPGAPVMAFGLI